MHRDLRVESQHSNSLHSAQPINKPGSVMASLEPERKIARREDESALPNPIGWD
jgi:hypothetical protein